MGRRFESGYRLHGFTMQLRNSFLWLNLYHIILAVALAGLWWQWWHSDQIFSASLLVLASVILPLNSLLAYLTLSRLPYAVKLLTLNSLAIIVIIAYAFGTISS